MTLEGNIIKKYPKRGFYQQYRYEKVVTFKCKNCKKDKTSKLVIVIKDDWNQIICNGCYGKITEDFVS